MIDALPKARSICPSAASKARCLSIVSLSNRRNALCMIPLPPYFTGGPPVQRAAGRAYVPVLFSECNDEFGMAAARPEDRPKIRGTGLIPAAEAPCLRRLLFLIFAAEPPMFIQTEQTPNPATLKFLPGCTVMNSGTANFTHSSTPSRSPPAERLFALPEVTGGFLAADFTTVTKAGESTW